MTRLVHARDRRPDDGEGPPLPTERLWCGDALAGLPLACDLLLVDAPYGDRTHAGHDANLGGHRGGYRGRPSKEESYPRRALSYATWTPDDVRRAVAAWAPLVRGWFVSLTDHVLAPVWEAALAATGRYVFAPVACVSPGSRVRLAGDGPSQWAVQLVAARPRHAPYSRWGTLPGAYVYASEPMPIVGGKPLSLMRALVADYSRAGDMVCDPCCGAGSTLAAARDLGRRWCGVEIDEGTARLALDRVVGAGARDAELPLFAAR